MKHVRLAAYLRKSGDIGAITCVWQIGDGPSVADEIAMNGWDALEACPMCARTGWQIWEGSVRMGPEPEPDLIWAGQWRPPTDEEIRELVAG